MSNAGRAAPALKAARGLAARSPTLILAKKASIEQRNALMPEGMRGAAPACRLAKPAGIKVPSIVNEHSRRPTGAARSGGALTRQSPAGLRTLRRLVSGVAR